MNKIGIATDSHSSISPDVAKKLGIRVLPMPFTIDGETYYEEITLTRADFFRKLSQGSDISTSQASPEEVTALWDEMLTEYEALVYIPISSGLSGSCQTATALSREEPYAGRVFVVDNGRVASPQHVTILDAIALRDAGCDAPTIKAKLEEVREDMCIYVAVETLRHLKRGGRITPTVALVGTLLHIKPILYFTTGKLESFRNVRGMVKARLTMIEAVRHDLETRFAAQHARGDVALLAASSADEPTTASWLKQISEAFPGMPVLCDNLSLGVSCHIGEGGLGIGLSCHPRA